MTRSPSGMDVTVRAGTNSERTRPGAGSASGRKCGAVKCRLAAALGGDVPFPAEPGERVALLHRIAVAELAGLREVEAAEHALPAAIGDFEEDSAVGFGGIVRAEEIELSGELDFAARVDGGEFEVADDAVGGELGVGAEVDAPGHAFVVIGRRVCGRGSRRGGRRREAEREQASRAAKRIGRFYDGRSFGRAGEMTRGMDSPAIPSRGLNAGRGGGDFFAETPVNFAKFLLKRAARSRAARS